MPTGKGYAVLSIEERVAILEQKVEVLVELRQTLKEVRDWQMVWASQLQIWRWVPTMATSVLTAVAVALLIHYWLH